MTQLRLSNSEVKCFRRCRRQWYLSQYRRLRPREPLKPGSALSIGDLVHDALASYYDPAVKADPIAHVQSVMVTKLKEDPTREDDIVAENQLVTIMLEGYLDWLAETGADQEIQVEGTERMVEVPLKVEGIEATLLSKLDAPVTRLSDGAKLALEHKTTGSLEAPMSALKLDTQLLTEHLARFLDLIEQGATAEESYDACHGILYNQLRKVKRTARANPPFYGREDILHNIHELRSHWRHVAAWARQIHETHLRLNAGEDHHTVCPPSPTGDCKWDCAFFKVCVMADDGSDFEGALDAMYVEGNPLERYEQAKSI